MPLPQPGPDIDAVAALTTQLATLGPCVIALVGAPGAGKSTLAGALAYGLDAAVLSYAGCRAEVTGDPADPAGDPQAGQLLHGRLADRCAARLTTIVDGTHHLARSRARIVAIATDAGLPAVAVVLATVPVEVCLDRQHDRPGPTPGRPHSLRVPAHQVRAIHHAITHACPGLAGEGFLVHHLDLGARSHRRAEPTPD